MLPDHVSIILLSATVPNTKEFADWVGRTKKKDIYVISTPKRPVPLEHYLWAGREMYKIVDAKGSFLSLGYKDAGEALKRKQDKEREAAGLAPVQRVGARGAAPQRGGGGQRGAPTGRGGRGGPPPQRGRGGGGFGSSGPRSFQQQDRNLYVHLVGHLKKQQLLPVVIFSFSKKRCEEYAATLVNLDLATASDKSEVHVTIEKALSRLKGSDKKLPQIARMTDLLKRGIGVHHGGLLPIVKEGVNMPARCVVFSNIRKHDGRSFRDLLSGEYTQMSGRAGRRGLDATGVVIIVSGDELPDTVTLNKMMLGPSTKLTSQFRLTYNMILNLLRVEALRVEDMIKRSFSENASQRLLPDQQKEVVKAEKAFKSLPKLQCETCSSDIELFYEIAAEVVDRNRKIIALGLANPQGGKLLSTGRVVILRDARFTNRAAMLVQPNPSDVATRSALDRSYVMLVSVGRDEKGKRTADIKGDVPPRWPVSPETLLVDDVTYEYTIVSVSSITLVTDVLLKPDMAEIQRHRITAMQNVAEDLQGLAHGWVSNGSIPEVDWSKIKTLEFQDTLKSRQSFLARLEGKTCLTCPDFDKHYEVIHAKQDLLQRIAFLKMAISDQNLELLPDYEQRISVLKDLRHIDENQTVLLKGRVACEINASDELILTELILENTLASYEPEEVVALLSGFVFQEKTDVEPTLPPKLEQGRDDILNIADRVGRVQDFHKVAVPDSRSKLKFGLAEVVYEWAKGMPFEQITGLTDVAEGTIVRVITRLDEACREVRDAARVIGDTDLFKKMEEAQTKIKRDIVFAASLYF
ncbi:hypothetical protein FRB90_003297 [Tulasnella sp. 427]|nr:hypothetical protein FRB90_003297 [Tulasnella sp. 427]